MKKLALTTGILVILTVAIGITFSKPIKPLGEVTNPQDKDYIAPIDVNGTPIVYAYTDDNTGEDLIIATDSATYSSWNSAYVSFAIKNISATDQTMKIQFLYDGGASASEVEELVQDVPYQVTINDKGSKDYKCDSVVKNTCTVENDVIGTHQETRYKDVYVPIAKGMVEDLKGLDEKVIDSKFVAKEQVSNFIASGQTKYYRAKLIFSPKSSGAFLINAYGDAGSFGTLDPWYSSSWLYRKSITIDETKVTGSSDLTSFPVLVDLTDSNLQANAQTDADDILFTSADGTTKLDHEIELYTSSTGRLTAWVRIPTLDYNDNTIIYMYYGNAGASSQQNATGVWSNYRFVYHLGDGDSTSADFYQDSTSNNIDATLWDGDSDSTQDTGKIGYGYNFAGDADYMALSDVTDPTAYTVSAWVKYSTTSPINIFTRTNSSGPGTAWSHQMSIDANTRPVNYLYDQNAATSRCARSTDNTSQNTWYYIANTAQNGVGMGNFVDGVLKNTGSVDALWTGGDRYRIAQNTGVLESNPGAGCPNATAPGYFGGVIDELRLSLVVRSTDWIATEYNNQSATSTFYTIGTQETDTPAASNVPVMNLQGQMIIQGQIKI